MLKTLTVHFTVILIDYWLFDHVRVTMEPKVHWAQWARTGSEDLVVTLDPLVLKDLQERQWVNFYSIFMIKSFMNSGSEHDIFLHLL